MLEELERGHGGYTVLCLSCETPQPGFFHRQLDMLWPAQQEGIDQSLAAATLGFTPCRQALANHRDGAEPLLSAECQRQLPPHFYRYGSQLVCADAGMRT